MGGEVSVRLLQRSTVRRLNHESTWGVVLGAISLHCAVDHLLFLHDGPRERRRSQKPGYTSLMISSMSFLDLHFCTLLQSYVRSLFTIDCSGMI